jgi:transposase
MGMTFALSDWEMQEMAHYRRGGWTERELASYYRVSEKTVQRILRRLGVEPLRAARSHATTENG